MQLLETIVRTADAGALQVCFFGEGGDAIEVTLADGASCRSEDEAVAKAKALLVQTAAFGETSEEAHSYEQDRAGMEAGTTGQRTYRLEYREGEHVRSTPEVTLPDDEAARAEVERSALDLVAGSELPVDAHGWAVRAVDGDDNVVASITYEEALRLSKKADMPPAAI